jgi:hypothetical protein
MYPHAVPSRPAATPRSSASGQTSRPLRSCGKARCPDCDMELDTRGECLRCGLYGYPQWRELDGQPKWGSMIVSLGVMRGRRARGVGTKSSQGRPVRVSPSAPPPARAASMRIRARRRGSACRHHDALRRAARPRPRKVGKHVSSDVPKGWAVSRDQRNTSGPHAASHESCPGWWAAVSGLNRPGFPGDSAAWICAPTVASP